MIAISVLCAAYVMFLSSAYFNFRILHILYKCVFVRLATPKKAHWISRVAQGL